MDFFSSYYSQDQEGDDLWRKLHLLRDFLRHEDITAPIGSYYRPENDEDRRCILDKVGSLINFCEDCMDKGDGFCIINRRSWENAAFHPTKGVTLLEDPPKLAAIHIKRQAQFLCLLTKIYELIRDNVFRSKRDVYYQELATFDRQSSVDEAYDDICCTLSVQRRQLHILSASKGLIYGNATFTMDGQLCDMMSIKNGFPVPDDIESIQTINSGAEFILIIEKDAIFQQLIGSGIFDYFPALMLTGKGYPDVNTRELLRKLWDHLRLPVLCLVDADPYGVDILCTYKYGSLALAYCNEHYTVSQIRWLGVLPSELLQLGIPGHCRRCLNDRDVSKLSNLLERPYFMCNPDWTLQLKIMETTRQKAEIECLMELGQNYITSNYIVKKIKQGLWI